MNELHPLGEMIQAAQMKNGWSTRDLEREAERHGLPMKHSNFSRLKLEPVIAIKASQIQVLSKVLRRSPQLVAKAAMASMGVDMDSPAIDVPDAIRSSGKFSARDQRILLSVIDVMRGDESEHIDSTTILHSIREQGLAKAGDWHKAVRPVAPTSDTSQGQKIEPEGSITELHGADAEKYPAPPIESLAAHPKVKTVREQLDEETNERDGGDQ
ncbi:hypothetical protein [Arthrobacter sp. MYb213]|uniref:hypothetical protein n=1 Tax=Arthrobacter sp. MYb213 TaxID=1848595 RepID=UPI000CFD27BC|nr:hypothetical protein [Arthrobacter sp. MYb213]PRB69488.1 hypothetical protein CQ011_12050 [Arthrobacter sp. MYb213]